MTFDDKDLLQRATRSLVSLEHIRNKHLSKTLFENNRKSITPIITRLFVLLGSFGFGR